MERSTSIDGQRRVFGKRALAFLLLVLLTACCTVLFSSEKAEAKEQAIQPTGIELNYMKLTMTIGDTVSLTATVQPDDADDKNVTFSSSDESVATVSQAGEIAAVAAGEAQITAETTNGIKATCKVTVKKNIADAEVAPIPDQLWTGEIIKPVPTVTYEGRKLSFGGDYTLSYDNGCIGPGTGTITILGTGDFRGEKSVTFEIVKPVESVELDKDSLELTVGQSAGLTATVKPDDASNKTIEWKSSDERVATVSKDGTVTGVSAGTAVITATTVDGGKTATCNVAVTSPSPDPDPDKPDPANPGSPDSGNGSQSTLPKTGDSTGVFALGLASLMFIAGVGLLLRRRQN